MTGTWMRATRTWVVIAAFLLLAVPGAALAQSATATGTPAGTTGAAGPPASAGSPAAAIDVQMWPTEADGSSVIVSADLPADAKLPFTVRLPMPAGIKVTWCGEVFGGDPSQDTEAPYTIGDGQGGKVLVVTATKARRVQYEGTLTSPVQTGERFETVLEWVQSAPSGDQHFAVKAAATAGDMRIEPAFQGTPQQNAQGERLYSLPTQKLSVGSPFKVTVSWKTVLPGSVGTGATPRGGASDVVLFVLIGALVVAIVALVVVASRQRRATAGADELDVPPLDERRPSRANRRRSEPDTAEPAASEPAREPAGSDDPFDDLD